MKLVKPNWVTHDDNPIFSIDIHPDGKRFATGGQGADSGRVVIWNMEPIKDETVEINQNVAKMLCQIDNHLACVNCVRWSSTGLLASGGDDKLIMIWRFAGASIGGSSIFGGKAGVETWRCIATLRAHEGDILDIAWAPHNPWLASASVDNNIIIWDATKFPSIVAVLKGHTGLVKGVTWDPVGKYIASQSDDKTLRVWRTNDWGEATLISEPFDECGGTTHVLRLSWSPDGQYLVSAHAMNGGGPTAQIIERDGWTTDKDFVGHRKAVTCVRFNSKILQTKQPGSSKPTQYCCVAMGSRDRSLSVWLTYLKRPLVVIHDLFKNSVLDASWSPCGMRLAACSWDGTVVFIEFSQQEIGQPLDAVEQSKVHERMYGKTLIQGGGCTVMESAELLKVKPPTPKSETQPTEMNDSIQTVTTSTPVKAPINKQIETRTSDGRRRITPMFIPPPADTTDITTVIGVSAPTFSSTSQTKSSIVIEKRDDIVTPNVSSTVNAATNSSAPTLTLKRREQTTPKLHHHHHSTPHKKLKFASERSGSQIFLPALKAANSISQQAGHYAVTVTNSQGLAHLQVFHGTDTEPLWNLYLGYNAVALSASPSIIALGLIDGSVHTFHPAKGTRPVPPLAPPAPLARLHTVGSAVMVISSCGAVRVWEIGNVCRLIVSTSAEHLAAPGTSLLSCTLYNGMPHLAFTNARAYIYHKEMGTWMLIGDSQDPVWRWSANNASSTAGTRVPRGPLSALQEGLHRTAGSSLPNPRLPHSAPCVVSYLEQQLLASKALGSASEYIHWLMALVSFLLTQDGLEKRLRIILDELMGPSHTTAGKSVWEPSILGIKKHKILGDVLVVLGGHLRWQRLYLEYCEQLSAIKNSANL